MNYHELLGLQVYAATYAAVALVLTLWILPGLVATLTPLRYADLVGPTRDALVTAFATGSVFVVLPILGEKSKELLRQHEADASESESVVDVIVPSSFNFPSAGKLLTLSFVLFAGWLSGYGVSLSEYPSFVAAGLFSFFGSTFVAIPFLLDLFRIPSDTFNLFVIVDSVIGSRFGAALAAMHILVLTLLSACAVSGLVTVRWKKLLRFGVITIALTVVALGGVRLTFQAMGDRYDKYQLFIERPLLYDPVPLKILDQPPEKIRPADRRKPTLDRIHENGFLRAGFLKDLLPFAFRNANGDLVGLDIEMAHVLARELGVTLELVRIDMQDIPRLLESGYLDIVMSGVAVTTDRMQNMAFSASYLDETLAFVVKDYRRDEFNSRKAVKNLEAPKFGIPPSRYYAAKVRAYVPQAELVVLDSPRDFFTKRSEELDALVYSAERGSSWSLIYPEFTVAIPHPDVFAIPVAYPLARGDEEMVGFVSTWVELKKKDKTIESLFDYWVGGKTTASSQPRWSIIRNVLKWVE
jgi:ABC-type amino acid transport substrate-binding protein